MKIKIETTIKRYHKYLLKNYQKLLFIYINFLTFDFIAATED